MALNRLIQWQSYLAALGKYIADGREMGRPALGDHAGKITALVV